MQAPVVEATRLTHEAEQTFWQGSFGLGPADPGRPRQVEAVSDQVEPIAHAQFAVVAGMECAATAGAE